MAEAMASHPGARAVLVLEAPGQGGTEVYVEGLASHLAQSMAVEIIVLSGSDAEARQRFPHHAVRAVQGPEGLASLLRSMERPLVANMHLYSRLLPAVRAARSARVPVVTTLHMPLAPWSLRHRLRWLLAAALSHACVGVSAACLKGYGPMLFNKPRLTVSGPLPLEDMPPARAPGNAPTEGFTVAYAGRLSREKDLPTLIRATAACEGAKLLIIGDGPQRGALEQLAEQLGVSATFTGSLPRTEVFERLQHADAFVLPSRFEGLGLAAIEAMALGVPTVTADFPAAAEYLQPEETGLVFPIGDHGCLTRQLERLKSDPRLSGRLSRAGAAHVRTAFTADAQYGQYQALFEGMLQREPGDAESADDASSSKQPE